MASIIDHLVSRPLVAVWLRFSPHSSHRLAIASDSPQVHAPGTYPDRILIAGDGASTGRGVATHDLGLPGYLARAVSAMTGRAADVDIVVAGDMTARRCRAAIATLEMSRFDAVVLSVGTVEALAFTTRARWRRDLRALVDRIEADAPVSTMVLLLSIPRSSTPSRFPGGLARAADRRATRLNRVTLEVIRDRPRVRLVVVGNADAHESDGAQTYERWGASVAPHLAEALVSHDGPNQRAEQTDESGRSAAHDALGMSTRRPDPELLALADRTRSMFGAAFAAVTLVGGTGHSEASASGVAARNRSLHEGLCGQAILRAEHFAVDDLQLDSRQAQAGFPTGPADHRFFAAYPLESTDGHRVGVLCVTDTEPRHFTEQDAAFLRLLALEAQRRLWQLSAGADAARPRPRTAR